MDEQNPKTETLDKIAIKSLYTPGDWYPADDNYMSKLAMSGEYPFTRGLYSQMYRKRPWTSRLFCGFGTAEETNKRLHYLLKAGEDGLSIAFDIPTLMGRDSDHPKSRCDIGRGGVAIDTLSDFRRLFKNIPVDKISTSMTINAPAAILWAMYIVNAEKQGVAREFLRGTIQNDCLKEFHAQNEWIVPPRPSLKLVVDTIEFGTKEMPLWNTVSISGYHMREAGATLVEELAFTLADGLQYVQSSQERGLNVDDFAPRLSFFFDVAVDGGTSFLEEVAKFRAARRMWACFMKNRFDAKNPKSMMLRTHAQTAGYTLTQEQPLNNIVRVTLQALAAVLGGVQSLHTNSYDEQLSLPSKEAAQVALRTQQILRHESGICDIIDPLGGAFALEALTDEMESRAREEIDKIDRMGGMIVAAENGYVRSRLDKSAFKFQQKKEAGEIKIVGQTIFNDEPPPAAEFMVSQKSQEEQLKELAKAKKRRSQKKVRKALDNLKKITESGENVMPYIIDAVGSEATLGEICLALQEVYGIYSDVAP